RVVDANDQGPDLLVADAAFDRLGNAVAAGIAPGRATVDDHPGDGHDADWSARILVHLVGEVGSESNLAVTVGRLPGFAAERPQTRFKIAAVADPVDQARAQGRPRHVAAGGIDRAGQIG